MVFSLSQLEHFMELYILVLFTLSGYKTDWGKSSDTTVKI